MKRSEEAWFLQGVANVACIVDAGLATTRESGRRARLRELVRGHSADDPIKAHWAAFTWPA